AVKTMIDQALLRNFGGGDGSHSSHADNPRNMHTARPCYYTDFMKCHPLNFKGTEGAVGLTRWIEKMESVFNISGLHTMTWSMLKKKMTDKYCPLGEVKKLEIGLWNLKGRDNNIPSYTNRFQELAIICTKFVSNETEKVDKYISGLPDNMLRTNAERKSDSKRKVDDISKNNQQPFKRQNVTKAYNIGSAEKKNYEGNAPKCIKCQRNHSGPCTLKCHKCGKIGHYARDYRSTGNTNATNNRGGNGPNPRGNDCPKLKNKDGGNRNAQGWVYDVGNAERNAKCCKKPGLKCRHGEEWKCCKKPGLKCRHGAKVCHVFLAQISATKEDDKSEGKQVKDIPIVQDFPKVFPENLPGLPPARPVEFHIDLIPGAAHMARAPYCLAPSEMKELSEQLQELSDKGFIRP
nr:reverse transcriptase domain-containing protein [Tanacetum cinerariifolium]